MQQLEEGKVYFGQPKEKFWFSFNFSRSSSNLLNSMQTSNGLIQSPPTQTFYISALALNLEAY